MNRRLQGYQIKLLSSSLILKLELFSNKDKRKIENLKLNQIPSTTILIRNKKFKVLSAIFHQGSNFNSGCYHNMLRQGTHIARNVSQTFFAMWGSTELKSAALT